MNRLHAALLAAVLIGGPVLVTSPAAGAAGGWPVSVTGSAPGAARSGSLPEAPATAVAGCVGDQVEVSWAAIDGATSYVVQTAVDGPAGPYTTQDTVATTAWSGPLPPGTYWFTVSAALGSNWVSERSAATAPRTVGAGSCT